MNKEKQNSLKLGRLMATRGVANKMADRPDFEQFARQAFARYRRGDWGEMTESDKRQNDAAVRNGDDRILAAYTNSEHPDWKLWIITEWDRSATTLLFPDEY